MFIKCTHCKKIYDKAQLTKNSYICPFCGYYETMTANQRLCEILDSHSFAEDTNCYEFKDPLEFPGYPDKFKTATQNTGLKEAVVTGKGLIHQIPVLIGVMDSRFMMASMGTVVGEKITSLFEQGIAQKLPVILFSASGGARMQEGIFSLMQMAKTASAASSFSESGGLYISILTNPTTGGVSASFAFLGDIILAEPQAIIGFAGKRVIEQTINEKIPEDFQTAEYLLEHGFIDTIVTRKKMKDHLYTLLTLHNYKKEGIQVEAKRPTKFMEKHPASQKQHTHSQP